MGKELATKGNIWHKLLSDEETAFSEDYRPCLINSALERPVRPLYVSLYMFFIEFVFCCHFLQFFFLNKLTYKFT